MSIETKEKLQRLRALGFKCLEPRTVTLDDGSKVIVTANCHLENFERLGDSPRQKAALRFYSLKRDGNPNTTFRRESFDAEREVAQGERTSWVEMLSELQLETRIGRDQFLN